MEADLISAWVSGISLIVAIISLVYSTKAQNQATKLGNENMQLSFGMLELEVRTAIREENARVNEISMKLNPLIAKMKSNSLTSENEHELESLKLNWNAAIQGMLNAYEEACTKYIDKKIDRIRFRKTYQIEIRNLLEAEHLKKYFDPHTSRYKGILKVYNEWENPES